MKAIDKFILHVVHNLFPLNEYSQGEMDRLMTQFKDEAEDLNIQVSDEQLKKYIERFDTLKNNPKVTDKDLRKYSLSKLIKLVTSSPGVELPSDEEEDNTPDVVYNDNGITIWNGAKQGNCITYGASQRTPGGSKWCITEPGGSYFGRYRYGAEYNYPTFYLAKNNNLPDSDRLSFVSLQVLDNGEYKFTNRANTPGMEGPFSWDELNRRVPWLRDIPNLKNILKYIPFSKSEKESEVFKNNPISIKQWMKEPFSTKKQYLTIRAGQSQLFSDISNDLFISKYLPQYPQVATMIAGTTGIIDMGVLIQHLDKFSKQDQLSIAKQIRSKFNLSILDKDIPFDLKKYLVKTDKLNLESNQRIYVTEDSQSIVLLTLGDDIKVGLYTEEDEYPNIKLNKRTAKYLLDYPELDKIPFKNLIDLVSEDVIDKSLVDKVIENAKKDPNSAIIVKDIDGTDILLDSNSFTSYKIEDGKITKIPFDTEEVQQVFNGSKDNEGLQTNVIGMLDQQSIPESVDRDGLLSIVKAIPYSKRITNDGRIIMTTDDPSISMFSMDPNNITNLRPSYTWGDVNGNWRRRGGSSNYIDNASAWQSYFTYLRSINRSYNSNEIQRILKIDAGRSGISAKKAFIRANPPIADDSIYRPVMNGDTALLINLQNPRESFKVSDTSGKLNQANVPASLARQLTGQDQPAAGQIAAQVGGVARRGRPAGQPNAPQPAAPAAAGNVNVGERMQAAGITNGFLDLPRGVRNRINVNNANTTVLGGNRGASRRQNILGGAGRVTSIIEVGPSTIYLIRLNNGSTVASVVSQPGNEHFLVTAQSAYRLGSPADLLQALQQRNLAEIHQYIVNEYMERNPEHLNEFKELLRKHINEKKK
jgi:hypothetical protein